MKLKFTVLSLALTAITLFTTELYAQEPQAETQLDVKSQETLDEEKMAAAKSDRKETKAKAREAQRVEGDANDAARESKNALKAERKAQKARRRADKQAKTAEDAREKSNKN